MWLSIVRCSSEHWHPVPDKVLQPARQVLRDLWEKQERLWRGVPVLPLQDLPGRAEDSRARSERPGVWNNGGAPVWQCHTFGLQAIPGQPASCMLVPLWRKNRSVRKPLKLVGRRQWRTVKEHAFISWNHLIFGIGHCKTFLDCVLILKPHSEKEWRVGRSREKSRTRSK